jgi:4-hydroxy-tetrahydrodipicolinate synthase
MPVDATGQMDLPRTLAHGKRLIAAGSDGLTLFGTTGEGTAFTVAQRKALVEAFVAAGVPGRQLIVNLSALALDDAVELGRHAMQHQAAGTMLMPPFYFNAPRDAGVVEAVSYVVRAVNDPNIRLLLYHFPSLCNVAFSHASIGELARRHPGQVVGIKDSSGDLPHSLGLAKAFPELCILVGSEPDVAPTMLAGGTGSVNGLANLAPRLMRRVIDNPAHVSAADKALMHGLLGLLSVRPNMPFVSAYKTGLAEQTGDDAWLNVCAPLTPLDNTEAQAVREAYRALNIDPATV